MNMRKITLCKGFTLLEILLSLTVIIILMLILIPTLQKMQQQESVSTATLQMNNIANAASQYYSMHQVWPQNLNDLNALLGYTGKSPNPFCSVWRNQSGCTPYTMASGASSHYFALSVVVPNTVVATQLAKNLPVAYVSGTNNTTVTAYTTIFRGFRPPPPSGVLFSMNNQQLNGGCAFNSSTPTPFSNCISASYTPQTSYGLIDVAQSRTTSTPTNTIVAGNNFSNISGFGAASYDPAIVTCPMGTLPTMLFFPVGVWNTPGKTATPANFFLSLGHFITQKPGTSAPQILCLVSQVGTSSSSVDGRAQSNFFAGFGDVLCLPSGAVTRWPDGVNIGVCGSNQ